MTSLLLLRVHDRPGSLERVLGTIRRKTLAVHRLSLHASEDGLHEIALRYDAGRTPTDRIVAELANLYDVHEVWPLDEADGAHTREMVIAHVRGAAADGPDEAGRVIDRRPDSLVVELTGTPAEVDAALARLRATGTLAAAVRSGEVVVPFLGSPATGPEAGPRPGATHVQHGPAEGASTTAGGQAE